VRGFWNLRLVKLRRALTRTPIGNEEYEYERNKSEPVRADEPADRYDPAVQGLSAGAAAVRHKADPNGGSGSCQPLFWNMSQNRRNSAANDRSEG